MDLTQCRWLNAPAKATIKANALTVETDQGGDFWRNTYYGFTRHSGHALGMAVAEDFTFQLCIQARFEHLYDQAGLFLQQDDHHWVKAGIEFNDEAPAMSCVVTREDSDWSTGPFNGDPRRFWMRATLRDHVLRLQYSADGNTWPLLRLLSWQRQGALFVAPMCCTPERAGLIVNFSDIRLGPALDKPLHDLS